MEIEVGTPYYSNIRECRVQEIEISVYNSDTLAKLDEMDLMTERQWVYSKTASLVKFDGHMHIGYHKNVLENGTRTYTATYLEVL